MLTDDEIAALRRGMKPFDGLLNDLLAEVAANAGLTPERVLSGGRGDIDAFRARCWFYLFAMERGVSASELGRFTGKDHTSVLNAVKRARTVGNVL